MGRKFFYVCAGMLMLAASFHLGSVTADAQQGSYFTLLDVNFARSGGSIYFFNEAWFQLPYGDITIPPGVAASNIVGYSHRYCVTSDGGTWFKPGTGAWSFRGYIPGGGPTPALRQTLGQLKQHFAPNPGTAKPGAQSR